MVYLVRSRGENAQVKVVAIHIVEGDLVVCRNAGRVVEHKNAYAATVGVALAGDVLYIVIVHLGVNCAIESNAYGKDAI